MNTGKRRKQQHGGGGGTATRAGSAMAKSASPMIGASTGGSILHSRFVSACRTNELSKVAALLPEIRDPDFRYLNQTTPLIHAASEGAAGVVRCLLSLNRQTAGSEPAVDIEARDQDGCTPLLWAAWNGRTEVADLLLKAGADKNGRDTVGLSVTRATAAEIALLVVRASLN